MGRKVLGIYGSPRRGGNSDVLLDQALAGAEAAGAEVRRIYAAKVKASGGCRECGGCDKTGECVVRDGMVEVYPLLDWAEVIILGGPIFFYGLPAQVKAVIDRAQARWNKRALAKPRSEWKNYRHGVGYLLAVGATKGQNLFDGAELSAKYFFDALDMSYGGGLFFRQMDKKGDARNNPAALSQAFEFGRRAAGEAG